LGGAVAERLMRGEVWKDFPVIVPHPPLTGHLPLRGRQIENKERFIWE
jgi:hypothetical protein